VAMGGQRSRRFDGELQHNQGKAAADELEHQRVADAGEQSRQNAGRHGQAEKGFDMGAQHAQILVSLLHA
jgi:hypothetical protein